MKDHQYLLHPEMGTESSQESTHRCALHQHRTPGWKVISVFVILIALMGWNVYLTIHQWHVSANLVVLEERTRHLEDICLDNQKVFSTVDNDKVRVRTNQEEDESDAYNHDEDDTNDLDNLLTLTQESQSIQSHEKDDGVRRVRRATNSRTKRNKKKNKSKAKGAHFSAYVDQDRVNREIAEGLSPSIGNITEYGLQPHDQIYKIWKPSDWSDLRTFQYNSSTGKVKVRSTGLYLIYGQIMFHGPSARKSYGIHINDETVPFIESLSFDNIHNGRTRTTRSVDPLGPDPNTVRIEPDPPTRHARRHKRANYASYSQCNTIAVTELKKNDEVFLRSLETTRTLIAQGYLTFWGMAKLA